MQLIGLLGGLGDTKCSLAGSLMGVAMEDGEVKGQQDPSLSGDEELGTLEHLMVTLSGGGDLWSQTRAPGPFTSSP
jgi:hypothetical protein